MAHFAGRREIGVKFPMRAASVDPKKHTTHDKTISTKMTFRLRPQTDFIQLVLSKLVLWGVPVLQGGRFERFFDKTPQKHNSRP